MNKPKLYTTPFIVAWIMLIVGLLGAFNLAYIPFFIDGYDGMGGGFAFAVIGIFIAITALIIFGVYGKLNADFRKMLAGDTLLSYDMPYELYMFFTQKAADDIKSNNKAVLFTILGFCVLIGIIFGLAIDTLYIFICLGIAVFFTIVYFIATASRTNNVKKSQTLVFLSAGGTYIFGEMNSWSMAGSWLSSVEFADGAQLGLPCPVILITYTALSGTIPQQHTVTIPVLPPLVNQALWAVNTIKSLYRV